jgi:Kef-type K+ transport system membrane component KefB
VLGILFSFSGGFGFALWWTAPHPEALYVGTALAATSIGISIEVLRQCGLLESRIGQVVVAAAVVDDILALYLLAVAHGVLSGDFVLWLLALSALLAFVVVAAVFWVARALGRLSIIYHRWNGGVTQIVGAIVLLLAFAWVTDWVDLSLVVGGFFAGLGLGEGLGEPARQELAQGLESFVLVLAPFFFVLIGAQAQLSFLTEPAMLLLLAGLLLVAMICKILGGLLGAVQTGTWSARLLIGVSMVPRGEVGLIIASLGFDQTHLNHHVFVTLVLMTIATSVLAPFAMVPLARKHTQIIETG